MRHSPIQSSPLPRDERRGWVRHYLKLAREAVARRDWLAASDFYRSAAFHSAIIDQSKKPRRRKP